MLVYARYENGGWNVDENSASLILEFRELLKDEKLGSKALAFVALYSDPSSFLAEIYDNDDDRYTEAVRSVYGDADIKKLLKDKKILAAIEKYQRIANTKSVKLRQQFQSAAEKVGEYIEKGSKKLGDDNIKDFMSTLDKVPDMIDRFTDMNKAKKDDLDDTKKKVRGDRALTYREEKKKRKK